MSVSLKHFATSSLLFTAALLIHQTPVVAAEFYLDWVEQAEAGQWPDGSQSGSFDIGGGTIDIDFTVGDGIDFVGFSDSGVTPAVTSVLNGANSDEDPSLHLQVDADQVGLGDGDYAITMNTYFKGYSDPLEEVSFWLHDIDISLRGLWQDRVSIMGYLDNQVVAPNFEFLDPSANTAERVDEFTLDGIDAVENDSSAGDVQVSFTQSIDRWSLTYTDGDDISRLINPNGHGIGVGDIYFRLPEERDDSKNIPEPSASLALLLVGACFSGLKGYLRSKLSV
ncbi:MAG: hypothetical protein ACFB0C_11690 [Leptolyngbyaceae cyanobacterium]